ncbi:hypothetical protein [Nocardioides sp. 503]|uniref:thermonuclease family protein n=1 Tax=Nocardioides sp. 503 TaxID=2508326 RepID=UPI0010700AA9|nr:hypothetical protein [Nocardioides sp. 503]
MFNQRLRPALLVLLCGVLLASAQVVLTPPAHAGQLGLVVQVQGAGSVRIVEGSVEDGAPTTCDQTDNQDANAVQACPRWRNSEVFEAWLWLRADPADFPADNWAQGNWSGCDKTRYAPGTLIVECGIGSGAFTSDEKVVTVRFRDYARPVVSPITQSRSTTQERTSTYFFSTSEGSTQCRFGQRAQYVDCASGVQHTWPAEGRHMVDVQATDSAGQVGATGTSTTVVDTAITGGPSATVSSRRAELSYSTVQGNEFWCALDRGPWNACGTGDRGTLTLDDLTDGPHSVAVYARIGDDLDLIPARRDWTVDATAPDTRLQVRRLEGGEAEFAYTGTETGTFECRHTVGSGAAEWGTCAPEGTRLSGLVPGEHRFEVRALDAVGNADESPARHSWTVAGPGDPTDPVDPVDPVDPHGPGTPAPGATRPARLVRVLDGDTVTVRTTGVRRPMKVDLAGLADPRRTCTGRAARRALARLLRPGASLTLVPTSRSRLTGASPWHVRVGRKDPALAQLRAGRARLQRAEAPPARRTAYARAQRDARRHERGLWGC